MGKYVEHIFMEQTDFEEDGVLVSIQGKNIIGVNPEDHGEEAVEAVEDMFFKMARALNLYPRIKPYYSMQTGQRRPIAPFGRAPLL